MVIEKVILTDKFERDVKKLRDRNIKERIDAEVKLIIANPDAGKPLRYGLKGERSIRISPYRLIYAVAGTNLILLRFEHRDEVYD